MSGRNKSRASGGQNKSSYQTKHAPAKSSPLAKAAPPPPKPPPSAVLRQEWKKFESWLKARREEKDKRVGERITEIMSSKVPKGRSIFQKSAPPSGSMDIGTFEASLTQDLAEKARAEWLKRVDALGLKEEDWTDITEEEMQAVEAAFTPTQAPVADIPDFSGVAGTSFDGQTSAFAGRNTWSASIPGGWAEPQANGTKPSANKTSALQDGVAHTTYAPIISDKDNKEKTSGLPTPDLLWELNRSKKLETASASPSSSFKSITTASAMRRSGSGPRNGNPISPASSATPSTTKSESLWDMHMSRSFSSNGAMSGADTHMLNKLSAEQPLASPESPWGIKKGTPTSITQKIHADVWDKPASPWDTYMQSKSLNDDASATTIPTETHDGDSSPNYVYLSPVLMELEEEERADLELLSEKTVEAAIKQFHQMAAEADITLRRKLLKENIDAEQHDELLEEHLRTMEQRCRDVVDGWKKAREAEKTKRLAEEKKKHEELEKKRLAEARKLSLNGKRMPASAKGAAARVKSPEPQTKKGQAKVGSANQKSRKATVEEVPDAEEVPDTQSIMESLKEDPLETDSDDIRVNVRPAKTPTSQLPFKRLGQGSWVPILEPSPRHPRSLQASCRGGEEALYLVKESVCFPETRHSGTEPVPLGNEVRQDGVKHPRGG
ncbi:hypothetical protein NM688_g7561 [Phlebia brevispora]|uniref:Uncharacterized protein n=1 Tax=Phlebia brevispora TaxID=194682 RepID=A0ACC1S3S0_9APHY|nr:hypothetical protein NM688_g7561 [Phlebia brevispora]